MKILLALRDERTGVYLSPITATTPGEAERTYLEILSQAGTIVQKYPADFPLYQIGEYDEEQGRVVPLDAPRLLVTAGQLGFGRKPELVKSEEVKA